MLKVGITGSIGSGKSTVCKIFELLGVPVYYADDAAKRLMSENKELKDQIKALLGKQAYDENELLDRKYIANIVFNDINKLNALNGIVHPAVAKDSELWNQAQDFPYTLKEAALLLESGSFKALDKLIVVAAPLELRINRVVIRDGVSRDEVLAREQKQFSEEKKKEHADIIINNDGETALVKQILVVHRKFLELAS